MKVFCKDTVIADGFVNTPVELLKRVDEERLANAVSYRVIFQSDFYRINDLSSFCGNRSILTPGYSGQFSISFTRSGYFNFRTYRRSDEEYSGRLMVEKPGCTFKYIQQEAGAAGATIINFTDEAFDTIRSRFKLSEVSFFNDVDAFGTVFSANAPAELLHHQILSRIRMQNADRFEIDCLVSDYVAEVMELLLGKTKTREIPPNTKRFHLKTIERAKEYLFENFTREITLKELAAYCYVSHFHFTRLFKQFTGTSPFHYLQEVRLQYAQNLLLNSNLPVADICFQSGFKRADYFSTLFAKAFGASPAKYRLREKDGKGTRARIQEWQAH